VKAARLSPDGRWAAAGLYDLENAGQDLWILDIKANAGSQWQRNTVTQAPSESSPAP